MTWGAILLVMHHPCAGVFAIVLLVSLPSLHWRLCRPSAGVFSLVTLSSLSSLRSLASPLLFRWRCHPYCQGIFVLVAFFTGANHPHCADVLTVILLALSFKAHIALVSFPLFHWCWHHRCVVPTNVGGYYHMPMDSILMCSNTLYMSNIDAGRSLVRIEASTMT